jgi:hypothetical protein
MNTQYYKEFMLNCVKLPMDVITVIKSFSFYDLKMAKIIRKAKEDKRKINQTILEAVTIQHPTTEEVIFYGTVDEYLPEHWAFGYIDHPTERIQLQGLNCLNCGNYMYWNPGTNPRLCCLCPV